MKNDVKKSTKDKLTLKREKLVALGMRTGVKAGEVPPIWPKHSGISMCLACPQ